MYTALLESVSGEIDIESEEECYHIKSGRLADLGFPPHYEALEIYSRINPATFTPGRNKALSHTGEATTLPVTFLTGKTFLGRVIPLVDSELFPMELIYLIKYRPSGRSGTSCRHGTDEVGSGKALRLPEHCPRVL